MFEITYWLSPKSLIRGYFHTVLQSPSPFHKLPFFVDLIVQIWIVTHLYYIFKQYILT